MLPGQVAADASGAATGRRAARRSRRAGRPAAGARPARRRCASSVSRPDGSSPPTSGSSKASSSRRSARATSRRRRPPSSGPSGVSIAAASPATTDAASPMLDAAPRAGGRDVRGDLGRRGRARRSRSPRRPRGRACRSSTPAGMSASGERRGERPASPRGEPASDRACLGVELVGDDGLLRLGGDAGLVRGRGGDVAERGAPPAPVDVAVEVARRSDRRRAAATAPSGPAAAAPTRATLMRPGARAASDSNVDGRPRRRRAVRFSDDGDVPVLVAREEQPAQRGVARSCVGRRPPHDRLVLRARQRDVREPQVLAALLDDVLAAVRGVRRALRGRRRSSAGRRRPGRGTRSGPGRRGTWVGSHRYGRYTTGNSSPLLRWIVSTCTASASDSRRRLRSSSPVSCSASAIRRRSHPVSAVVPRCSARAAAWSSCADVAQVGQPPLAAGEPQHALGQALGQRDLLDQRGDALHAQHPRPAVQALVDLLPRGFVGRRRPRSDDQPRNGVSAAARARGDGGRALDAPPSSRSQSRAWGVPNTLPAPLMTAGTPTSSSASRIERGRLVACGRARRRGRGGCGRRRRSASGATAARRGPRRRRARRAARALSTWMVVAVARRLDRGVVAVHDAHAQRRRVGRADEAGARAEPAAHRAVQRSPRARAARRRTARRRRRAGPGRCGSCARASPARRPPRAAFEVRVDVGAAERVDRLFRVADEHERPVAGAERAAHDAPLHRVGVLELVDEHDADSAPQPRRHGVVAPARRRAGSAGRRRS